MNFELHEGATPMAEVRSPRGDATVISIDAAARLRETRDRGAVIWLTGLSGAGKSSIATAAAARLRAGGVPVTILDGDVLRAGACRDLGFSTADRRENSRRAMEAALAGALAGNVVIAALIAPFRRDRAIVRKRCQAAEVSFAEVFVNAPLAACERRDPKQLYRRARAGEISAFTGISSPYETPLAPELELLTTQELVADSAAKLCALVRRLLDGG